MGRFSTREELERRKEDRDAQIKERDAEVEDLITRARRVQLGSPEVRKAKAELKAGYLQRKAAEEAARVKAEQEKADKEAARVKAEEEEVAKAKAEEKERLREEQEAEQTRLEEQFQESVYVKKQLLVSPLDEVWAEKVDRAMETRNPSQTLATTTEGAELSRRDFGKLLPTAHDAGNGVPGWLNDEIVNAWFAAIVVRKKEQTGYVKGPKSVPPYEAYNTGWYTSYTSKGSIDAIATWSRRKGIKGDKLLRCEKIFFPINKGAHWTLLVFSPQERSIAYLDSMHGASASALRVAREWLAMELGEKLYHADEWSESEVRSAVQRNMDDCGVFACINGLAAAKGVEFAAVEPESMPDARRLMAAVLLNGGFKGDFEL